MNNFSLPSIKDSIIIFFIIIVFVAVVLVFYSEIIKNNKITNTKNNFNYVRDELIVEIHNCKNNLESWLYGISCNIRPKEEIIIDYFNNTIQLINPHTGRKGVGGGPGSIQLDVRKHMFLLSADIDADGGIDIEYRINTD